MKWDIADLKESKAFLNDIYKNVTTAIFLADSDARLAHFNDAFSALFYKPEDQLIGELCGNAMGCPFVKDENLDCGSTSNCSRCELRASIIKSFTEHVPVYKQEMIRDFDICGKRLRKHFTFTTKFATYLGEAYVLVLFDDVTDLAEARETLRQKNAYLQAAAGSLTSELIERSNELAVIQEKNIELMQEIRHRIGNLLQILVSLLQYEGWRLEDFYRRLDTIIEVYRYTCYETGDITVPLIGFVQAIAEKEGNCSVTINWHKNAERSILIAPETATPLGLALVETLARVCRKQANSIKLSLGLSESEMEISFLADEDISDIYEDKLALAMIDQLSGTTCFPSASEFRIAIPFSAI
ncbi:MAG: sensor histidine kinase [Spirochaetaceae bacterium]|nr:MAG: sensor histidine kinase [Spirochaetaceae bacterium]